MSHQIMEQIILRILAPLLLKKKINNGLQTMHIWPIWSGRLKYPIRYKISLLYSNLFCICATRNEYDLCVILFGGLVVLQSNVCFATMGSIPVGGNHCPSYQWPYRLAKYPEGDRGVLSQRRVSFIGEVVIGSDVKLRDASASLLKSSPLINWGLGGHL